MSNFLADNVDWIVPMALLVVTSLYGHFKKRKIAEATAKAKPTPEVSRQIAKQIAMLQQKVEAKEPAPAQQGLLRARPCPTKACPQWKCCRLKRRWTSQLKQRNAATAISACAAL